MNLTILNNMLITITTERNNRQLGHLMVWPVLLFEYQDIPCLPAFECQSFSAVNDNDSKTCRATRRLYVVLSQGVRWTTLLKPTNIGRKQNWRACSITISVSGCIISGDAPLDVSGRSGLYGHLG